MSTVALAPDLGIETTRELKDLLAPHLEVADRIALDASQVSRIHTAAVQVLCAFVSTRRQAGHDTVLENCSDTFRDAARLLGVQPVLGLDVTSNNLKSVENAA